MDYRLRLALFKAKVAEVLGMPASDYRGLHNDGYDMATILGKLRERLGK